MKNQLTNKVVAWTMAVCLLLSGAGAARAENTSSADFDVLQPLMDLVVGAVMTASDQPEAVPGEGGTLSNAFVNALFGLGQSADSSLGLSADTLLNTDQQEAFLTKAFAAKAPALSPITQTEATNGYIGFLSVTVNSGAGDGSIQILGEIYWADKQIDQLSDAEYNNVQWLERGIFTFKNDDTAMNGFRLMGFTIGTDLNMEVALQDYTSGILVEYGNAKLGFSMQYPSVFTDDLLVEDDSGVSATLKDGSASFFAKRIENASQSDLTDYVNVIANGIPGATANVNEMFQYATLSYTTEEGFTVFDIYIVTDKYVYQAELSYRSDLASEYSMYTTYLENTFTVDEVTHG